MFLLIGTSDRGRLLNCCRSPHTVLLGDWSASAFASDARGKPIICCCSTWATSCASHTRPSASENAPSSPMISLPRAAAYAFPCARRSALLCPVEWRWAERVRRCALAAAVDHSATREETVPPAVWLDTWL